MATQPIEPASAWAQRHPAAARQELGFRRQARAIRKEFGRATYGTPETRFHASRTVQGALARLYVAGDVSLEQLAASQDIAAVHARITGEVTVGTMSMETRVDQSRRSEDTFFERLGSVRREVAYTKWRAVLSQRRDDGRAPAIGPVLAMIIEDIGVSVAAKRWRMRNAAAKKLLIEALDLWQAMLDEAFREIDEAELLAAQAGLLA